jgi:hypothetical protein
MSFCRCLAAALISLLFPGFLYNAAGQLSKGHLLLIENGLQVQAMVSPGSFQLPVYSNAHYTSVHWLWDSDTTVMAGAPEFLWSRWVDAETNMPGMPSRASESPFTNQLFSLQLADEWPLNDSAWRDRAVDWFNTVRSNWPNTILYGNNYGGQVSEANLVDFITRARPDMLCFDSYPFKSSYDPEPGNQIPLPPQLLNWYSDLRIYREYAKAYGIPLATYMQIFHAVQSWDSTVYRDPSASELRLNNSAALAFNAKTLIGFRYSSGACSLFNNGDDNSPTPLHPEQTDANLRASNLGKALVRLTPIYDMHNPGTVNPPPGPASGDPNFPNSTTTSIMFFRGKYLSGGVTNFNGWPISFAADPQSQNPANPTGIGYTWWESDKNDPYLRGWTITNKGTKNDGLPGDVILAWFKPLDESFDGPQYTNQLYFLVVNGLTDRTGTAADCLQEIKLNMLTTFTNIILLDPLTGQLQTNTPPIVSSRRVITLNLNGGDAALFKIDTGAPFVGFYPAQPPRLSIQLQATVPTLTLQGTVAARHQVQVASTLPATNWTTLTNLLLPSSPFVFQDTGASGSTRKFYRALVVP